MRPPAGERDRGGARAAGPRRTIALAWAAAASLLAGCAAPVAHRPAGPVAGRQGSAWEVVFDGPRIARDGAEPEIARRNDRLTPRPDLALSAADEWPEPPRPTLERPRRFFTGSSAREHVFFLRERPGRRRGW